MEKIEYQIMYEKENTFWWYRGLHSLVMQEIEKIKNNNDNFAILDAGCGTGRMLELLKDKYNNEINYTGIDFSEDAIAFCHKRGLSNVTEASVTDIPANDNSMDLIISLDVIYHQGVSDDVAALKEFERILKPGGSLILNLPAYEFMKSNHDAAVHTARRYTSKTLKEKLNAAGLSCEKITYRNTILFPAAFAVRMLQKILPEKSDNKSKSDLKDMPEIVNNIFAGMLDIENKIINHGLKFPFGLSLFCIAQKRI